MLNEDEDISRCWKCRVQDRDEVRWELIHFCQDRYRRVGSRFVLCLANRQVTYRT